ncbi:MAG TPA: hypothetical protein VFN67_04845 [Polyangiales bacterium]|jgi:hypothetical protein|nr:hypothetical protein [Polyangiales bacterium]
MVSAPRVYLLSPARTNSLRAGQLAHSETPLGVALRSPQGAPLGEAFAYLSSLYFRGKLAYASRFGSTSLAVPGALVITPGHGLCRPSTRVRSADLAAMGQIEVDAENPVFVQPLLRDIKRLVKSAPADTEFVLLGSIATPKYVEPLSSVLEERLLFPREFVGRGDMSRGGMLLRAARDGTQLEYVPVQNAVLKGPRARKLAALR